jgi:hypothetical protein
MCPDDQKKLFAQIDRIESKLDTALHGPDGKSGLIVDVDRLKTAEERRKWTIRTLTVAVLGLIGNWVNSTFLKSS